MNWQVLMESKLVENLGWTLVHSMWEIGVVTGILFILLRIIRPASTDLRYGISVIALLISMSLPVATFIWVSNDGSSQRLFANAGPRAENERDLNDGGRNIARSGSVPVSQSAVDRAASKTSDFFAGLRAFFSQ